MRKTSFRERLTQLREGLSGIRPDTLWIIRPENRRYLSGFKADDGQLTESSGSLLINDRTARLITDSRYTTEAIKEAVDFEVITLKKGLIESLPEQLTQLGTKVLGFEEDLAVKLVTAIVAVAGLFILGTAAEDVAEKLSRPDGDA